MRYARRAVVLVVGLTVVAVGLVMVVTPGPAIVVVPLGLAILATEFVWAKRLLRRARVEATRRIKAAGGRGGECDGAGSRERMDGCNDDA